jgi:hypothetical protein
LENIHDLCKPIGELNFGLSVKQRHGYKHSRANHQVYRLRLLRENLIGDNNHTYNITIKQTLEKIQTNGLKKPIQSTRLTQNKHLSQA